MSRLILIKIIAASCLLGLCTVTMLQCLIEKDYIWACVYIVLISIQFCILILDIKNEIDNQ